jgi:PAS domain S-box-containing protein
VSALIGMKTLVAVSLLWFSFTSFSRTYLVHHYTERQGLPTSTVYDVAQDKMGQLWFSTRLGVSVYDGVSWKNHTRSDGLPSLGYSKIKIDRNGTVWVLGSSFGQPRIYYYKDNKWQKFYSLPIRESQFVEISCFGLLSGRDWPRLAVGTLKHGLYIWNGDKWLHYTVENGLPGLCVSGVAALNGRFYAATDGGLAVVADYGVDRSVGRRLKLPSVPLKGIGVESKRVWLLAEGWLAYFVEGEYDLVRYSLPAVFLAGERYFTLAPDYTSGIYLGNRNRIYYFNYNTGELEPIGMENGLISGGASSIFADFEGNIWIFCDRGVSKIASRRFESFQMKHGLLDDEVTAILEYEPGQLVFGHNTGVTFYDGRDFEPIPFDRSGPAGLLLSRVMDIKRDSRQNIWLAASQFGLCRLGPDRKMEWYGRELAKRDPFNCLCIDERDSVWVGTSHVIMELRGNELSLLEIAKEIRSPGFRRIYAVSGRIYLATAGNGVYEYKNKRWRNYLASTDSAVNSVYAVARDHDGQILLGTMRGVYGLKEGDIKPFMPGRLHLYRPVFFILKDQNRGLWLGTDNGVVHWDGQRQFCYGIQEGLIGQETNRAAAIIDSKGRTWFGTNQGVSCYHGEFDRLKIRGAPPRLQLLYLEAAGRKLPLNGSHSLKLDPRENNVVFHFRAISFLDEQAIRFKHKLEGLDKEWSTEHYPYRQMIRYENIPAGVYRFAIKARNTLGVWSPVKRSSLIEVARPFYRQWWVYMLVAAAIALILAGIHRYFSVKRHSSLLERHVKERSDLLRAAEERYSRLFLDSRDAAVFISPDGRLFDINPAGLELFGYAAKDDIYIVNIFESHFSVPHDQETFCRQIEEKGYVKDLELVLKRANDEAFTALVTATAVKNTQGQVVAYQGVFRDITERRRLERQLEQARKMEAIGTLAGGVAHDLNNILSGLINYPELLLMDIPKESPVGKTVLAIKKTGEKAAAIVQDLLTLSKGASGIHDVVNLNDVVGEYLVSPEYEVLKMSHPQVHFEVQLSAELANMVGSAVHLFKVVMNLVTNAAEAIRGDGICVIGTENVSIQDPIQAFENIESGEYALLSVRDNGVGIPAENINRIFEPFYTTKIMGRSGTGLGMSVVWATVKDHRGYIDVESEVGVGTTFKLYFPASRRLVRKEKSLQEIDRYRGKEHILVVDDVAEQRKIASAILEKLGYRVTSLSSGEEAIEFLKRESVDLVVLDMLMTPGMDGLQTYRHILKHHPRQKAVIVSGFSKTQRIIEAQNLGVGAFVQKPYTIEKIGLIIREELAKER